MIFTKNLFAVTYLVLLSISIYTPRFGVLDKMAIQYFLISISNLIAITGFTFIYRKDLLKPFKHPLVLALLGYLVMAILSIIKSLNVIESLVELGHITTIFLSLALLVFLIKEKLIKTTHILIIITISLIVDISFSLSAYLPYVYNDVIYSFDDNWKLVGLFGNRNILATSIAFRIPLVILLAERLKNNNIYIFSFLLSIVGFFNISLLSSRATYLSIIICILFFIIISLVRYFKDKKNILHVNRTIIFLYLVPCLVAYFMSVKAIDPGPQGNVASRISTITSTNDTSKNTRIRYYTQSLTHIMKNPVLGAGIGNWKILKTFKII